MYCIIDGSCPGARMLSLVLQEVQSIIEAKWNVIGDRILEQVVPTPEQHTPVMVHVIDQMTMAPEHRRALVAMLVDRIEDEMVHREMNSVMYK